MHEHLELNKKILNLSLSLSLSPSLSLSLSLSLPLSLSPSLSSIIEMFDTFEFPVHIS